MMTSENGSDKPGAMAQPFDNQSNIQSLHGSTSESLRSSSGVGGDARARRLGRLDPENTAIFVCDLQERFAPSIVHFNTIVENTERILKTANMLSIPIIATEQYPKVSKIMLL